MNLLVVSPNLPQPTWGAATRNYYLLKALSSRHSVSLLAWDDRTAEAKTYPPLLVEDLVGSLQLLPSPSLSSSKRVQQLMGVLRGKSYMVETYTRPEMQDALDALVAQKQYDAVVFESAFLAGYRLPSGLKIIVDQHNIEHELLRRTFQNEKMGVRKWYSLLESRALKPIEIERCRRTDVLIVTSDREKQFWQHLLPQNVIEVVPNGVDTELFHGEKKAQEKTHQIIFTGAMSYYPNVDAVCSFAKNCWPFIRARVPDATWLIVGANPLPEVQDLAKLPGVIVTGSVDNVQPFLESSAVAIVPLRIGSGTRLKILEALAMCKAVVSTSVGCEGLLVEPGKHLMIADQSEAFAKAVVMLLKDQAMRAAYGSAGRLRVEAEYSWQRSGDRLLQAIDKIHEYVYK